jgi:hypothetical protein
MPDRDNEPIDPPDNQGGGNLADSSSTDAAPIDPPDNQGGGSGG